MIYIKKVNRIVNKVLKSLASLLPVHMILTMFTKAFVFFFDNRRRLLYNMGHASRLKALSMLRCKGYAPGPALAGKNSKYFKALNFHRCSFGNHYLQSFNSLYNLIGSIAWSNLW